MESLGDWRNVSLGFLAASFALLVSWLLSGQFLISVGVTPDSAPGLAFAKLFDALPIVITAILVAAREGRGLQISIFGGERSRPG